MRTVLTKNLLWFAGVALAGVFAAASRVSAWHGAGGRHGFIGITRMNKIVLAGVCATLVCLASQAQAALVLFPTQAAFAAAVGATTNVVLPEFGLVGPAPASRTVGNLTFTAGPNATDLFIGTGGGFLPQLPDFSTVLGPLDNDIGLSDAEDLIIDLTTPAFAFAFNIHEPTTNNGSVPDSCNAPCVDTTFTIEAFAGAVSQGSFLFNPTDDTAAFVGFSNAIAFDRVTITDQLDIPPTPGNPGTDNVDNEFFNDFRFATSLPLPGTPSIPEPGTLALLGFGLAGLGFARRRRAV